VSIKVEMRWDEGFTARVDIVAKRLNMSRSAFVRMLVDEGCARLEEDTPRLDGIVPAPPRPGPCDHPAKPGISPAGFCRTCQTFVGEPAVASVG
jgi:hypothetical protein